MTARAQGGPVDMTLGIIGCGNMGGAIARGIQAGRVLPEGALFVSARRPDSREAMRSIGAVVCSGAEELVTRADYVLLAVKPYQMVAALEELSPFLSPGKVLVSVAAGFSCESMRIASGCRAPVARVMPNTLVSVGAGVFGLCVDDPRLSPEQCANLSALFSALGEVIVLAEEKMNAFSALAGCGPAYVFHFADALIEAGVTMGLARKASTEIVWSLLRGGAALAQTSGEHPAVLREQVTSPGGMTIAGTNHLDRTGVRGHVVDAVLRAEARGREMEEES